MKREHILKDWTKKVYKYDNSYQRYYKKYYDENREMILERNKSYWKAYREKQWKKERVKMSYEEIREKQRIKYIENKKKKLQEKINAMRNLCF